MSGPEHHLQKDLIERLRQPIEGFSQATQAIRETLASAIEVDDLSSIVETYLELMQQPEVVEQWEQFTLIQMEQVGMIPRVRDYVDQAEEILRKGTENG